MTSRESKFEVKPPSTDFRRLVEKLIKDSDLFAYRDEQSGESVIDAIEKNDLFHYLGERPSDKENDAATYLVAIYDELKKPSPNKDFIEETVESLKDLL